MENSPPTEEQKPDLLQSISKKAATALLGIILAGSSVGGGVSGGVVSKLSQGNAAQGITQDQADLRYVTKEFAEARINLRDKQNADMRKETLSRDVYEAYRMADERQHQADMQRMDSIEKKIDQILDRLVSR